MKGWGGEGEERGLKKRGEWNDVVLWNRKAVVGQLRSYSYFLNVEKTTVEIFPAAYVGGGGGGGPLLEVGPYGQL